MALKIVEFIITPTEYAADAASDLDNTPFVDAPDTIKSIQGTDQDVDCPMCKGQDCTCKNASCKICKDHLNGDHNFNKVEALNKTIDGIFEDANIVIKDISKSYHEVTSFKDGAFKYLKDYKIDFKPGDLVYVIKRNVKRDAKKYKSLFDKNMLPVLKKNAELVASGDEFYHFRPTKGSKLIKALQKFAGSDTGTVGLNLLAGVFGVPGVDQLGRYLFKTASDVSKAGDK